MKMDSSKQKFDTAIIVGAGAFGTCIASVLANNFKKVILKVRSEDVYLAIKNKRENSVYLPNIKLAENIQSALTWEEFDQQMLGSKLEIIISGLPTAGITSFFNDQYERFKTYLDQGVPLVSLSKGIDPVTLELSDDLFMDLFSQHRELFCFLSGPSFAKEVMEEQITLVTLAGRSKRILSLVANMMDTTYFKVLLSYDVKGVSTWRGLKKHFGHSWRDY